MPNLDVVGSKSSENNTSDINLRNKELLSICHRVLPEIVEIAPDSGGTGGQKGLMAIAMQAASKAKQSRDRMAKGSLSVARESGEAGYDRGDLWCFLSSVCGGDACNRKAGLMQHVKARSRARWEGEEQTVDKDEGNGDRGGVWSGVVGTDSSKKLGRGKHLRRNLTNK
ncbi:hypothetical protein L7F22_055863 [Adiantum nelumboides]|nr:hypothetical protein [Adiantum nelumboides]